MNNKYARIRNIDQLRDEILSLRLRSERQKEHLHDTFMDLKESVKPANLARQTLGAVKNAGKNNGLMKTVLGLGGGAAARRLLFGQPKGFFGKIWAAGIQKLLTRMLANPGKSAKENGSAKWVELLTGAPAQGKMRIILGNKGARFEPPVTLFPAEK